jgi:hypothetical protein
MSKKRWGPDWLYGEPLPPPKRPKILDEPLFRALVTNRLLAMAEVLFIIPFVVPLVAVAKWGSGWVVSLFGLSPEWGELFTGVLFLATGVCSYLVLDRIWSRYDERRAAERDAGGRPY